MAMETGHGWQDAIGVVGMVSRAGDDGLKWAKANWQVLTLAATIIVGGTQALAEIETLGKRVGVVESGQSGIVASVAAADAKVGLVLQELRDLRKDLRAMRPINNK